jgi:hypothetical protein
LARQKRKELDEENDSSTSWFETNIVSLFILMRSIEVYIFILGLEKARTN